MACWCLRKNVVMLKERSCCPHLCVSTGYGYAADLWSLGVLTFELLTVYTPFQAQGPMQVRITPPHCHQPSLAPTSPLPSRRLVST